MIRSRPRRGYALIIVVVFLLLLLSAWGVAFRQTATLLRLETARASRVFPDQANALMLARALALLETGTPESQPSWSTDTSKYEATATVAAASGDQSFLVTFQKQGSGSWSVRVQPGANGVTLPETFGP